MYITELTIATNVLDAQEAFYSNALGLTCVVRADDVRSFQVGASRLTFRRAAGPLAGVYHFAFNIPHNQFAAAQRWIEARAVLLADVHGATTFYSQGWNADMLYFADPVGNIVELIARHTLANADERPFDHEQLLNISEIGVAAEDVPAQVADIQARTGATVYQGPSHPAFTPVGDEHGLMIVVQHGRIWYPDTGKPAVPLPVSVVIDHEPVPVELRFA